MTHNLKKKIWLVVSGLILSALIALISFVFLISEHLLSDLLWQHLIPAKDGRVLYIVMLTLIGGTVVSWLHQKWGALPQTAEASLAELRQQKTVDYHHVFKSLFLALIILVCGAGVGPEAGLLGAVVALSVWESDKLRYFYFEEADWDQLHGWKWLQRLLAPNHYLLTYDEARSQATNKQTVKKFFDSLLIINGLFMFVVLMKMSGQPSFVTKMGQSNWHWSELWLIGPLMGVRILFGVGYRYFAKGCQYLFSLWRRLPLLKAWLGALVIVLVAVFAPNLLFSGQISIALAPFMGQEKSFLFLITAAILKLIFLQICLNTGWLGGDIFPVTFASIIAGFAMAQLLPQFDHLLVVVIVATISLIVIMGKPLLATVFIALFFPLNLWPIIAMILLIVLVYQKVKVKLLPQTTGHV
ncbi:chloride channel protein [Lapidilactobacillus bayanensis]|uniref:chloride channel protein n=1 Tax=Lapidilactobacillus bayanensis TaxID=2485998 RepID=UPI000F77462E|nr:chloride channel protein [Lapidilactobacillus bayanensis]